MSDIVLTAGVRQNLLSLQNTAALIGTVQNRLATGKKVNTALDNPTNFFTSQALSNRASDLNSPLDSVGQAQKTLEATDKGLTSLTALVQSAKSIAKQARQTTSPTSNTFGQITLIGTSQAEVIGSITGTVNAVNQTTTGNLVVNVNGVLRTIALTTGDTPATAVTAINAVIGASGTNEAIASIVGGKLVLTATSAA